MATSKLGELHLYFKDSEPGEEVRHEERTFQSRLAPTFLSSGPARSSSGMG